MFYLGVHDTSVYATLHIRAAMEVGVWLGAGEVVQVGLSSSIKTWGDWRVLRKDSLEVASIGGSDSGI